MRQTVPDVIGQHFAAESGSIFLLNLFLVGSVKLVYFHMSDVSAVQGQTDGQTHRRMTCNCKTALCTIVNLFIPRTRLRHGERAFSVAVPHQWNRLPSEMRCISNTEQFKRHLKTFLFKSKCQQSENAKTFKGILTPCAILYPTLVCRPLLFWFSCKWRYRNVCLLLLLLVHRMVKTVTGTLYNSQYSTIRCK